MVRIVISCIILVITVHNSCLASSGGVADIAEQVQSEIQSPATSSRFRRAVLGVQVKFEECAHIGRSCSISRNDENNPTEVTITPCCDYLACTGIGPNEVRNVLGAALRVDPLASSGICTLSLDYNLAPKELDKYIAHVQNL